MRMEVADVASAIARILTQSFTVLPPKGGHVFGTAHRCAGRQGPRRVSARKALESARFRLSIRTATCSAAGETRILLVHEVFHNVSVLRLLFQTLYIVFQGLRVGISFVSAFFEYQRL